MYLFVGASNLKPVMQKLWGIQMLALTVVVLAITSVIADFSWRGVSRQLGRCQGKKVAREEDFNIRISQAWFLC